ncbi:MAG TPA: macro domain-containing protein, partial [Gemmatimonadales bacterium]|nr:macro domain-containing protein [Gemmatimonadales bacterium]
VIDVVVDDLAFLAVDAVIRPADEWLAPVTTASSRLDQQAGPRFADQRRVASPLDLGAAVVTGGGDLTAQFVLHVVIQSAEQSTDLATIRRALASAWHRAMEWRLTRVASPLIGAGPGRLGPEEAAELLAGSVPEPDESGFQPQLTIVLEREEDREMVEAAVRGRPR